MCTAVLPAMCWGGCSRPNADEHRLVLPERLDQPAEATSGLPPEAPSPRTPTVSSTDIRASFRLSEPDRYGDCTLTVRMANKTDYSVRVEYSVDRSISDLVTPSLYDLDETTEWTLHLKGREAYEEAVAVDCGRGFGVAAPTLHVDGPRADVRIPGMIAYDGVRGKWTVGLDGDPSTHIDTIQTFSLSVDVLSAEAISFEQKQLVKDWGTPVQN